MKFIKKLLLASSVMCGIQSQAQQLAMFTEYMYNEVTLNPAYAGSHEVISATLLGRKQWVGDNFAGAPETYSFNVHAPLRNQRVGVGLSLVNDQLGVMKNFNAMGSVSYIVPFAKSDLHFGLQLGAANTRTDYSTLNIYDVGDQNLVSGSSGMSPNFGLGMYYFAEKYYIGLSAPQLLNNQLKVNGNEVGSQVRHYFFNAGYVFELSPSVKFKPTVFLKYVSNVRPEADFTASFIIRDMFWVGGAIRTFDSVDLLLGLQATEQFKIGYAYDITSSALNQFNRGSHELVLNYRFSYSKGKMVTPRYF
jgi:type IX secretion system PorP/SprF family membrane protein